MSALSSYRNLFALTGPGYVVAAFLARLPLAMSQMGSLLLVAGVTGSYGAGGTSAGALAVVNGICSPLAGALTDRIGQRIVLIVQSVGASCGLVLLILLGSSNVPWQLLALVSALTGAFLPQVGALARVRWRELAKASGVSRFKLISTAFSYEGAADEASFVIGPALVGAIVALLSPQAALGLAAGLLAIFGMSFALHSSALTVPGHRGTARSTNGRLFSLLLIGMAGGQLLVGVIFGSVQTGTTALATRAGEPGLAGLLHGLLGVGSVLAGLSAAALPSGWKLPDRLPVFTAALTVLAAPLLGVNTIGVLAGVLLVMGVAIAPYMITNFSVCEQVIAPHHLGTAMMVLAAATNFGYALGSTIAGNLADHGGHSLAFVVPITAACCAFVLTLVLRRRLHRATPPPTTEPSLPLEE